MATDATDSVRVQCASCGGRFRIRRRPGGALPDQIRCPRCESVIQLADEAGPQGWVATSSESTARQPSEPSPPDTEPRPGDRGDSWEFKTARDARQSGSSIFTEESDVESGMTTVDRSEQSNQRSEQQPSGNPNPNAMPGGRSQPAHETDTERREPRRAKADQFESGSSRIEKLENVDQSDPDSVMTPLPANSIIEDEPDVDGGEQPDESGSPERERQQDPPSAAAIAEGEADYGETANADEQPTQTEADSHQRDEVTDTKSDDRSADRSEDTATTPQSFDWEAGQPLFIRVEEGTEREVTRDELLRLLREGVWTDAVEVRPANASTWIALRRHPVWDDIREEVVGHSRQIMLEGPGAPDAESDAQQTTDQPEPPSPESSSDQSGQTASKEPTHEPVPSDEGAQRADEESESQPDSSRAEDDSVPPAAATTPTDDVHWYRSAFTILLVVVALLVVAMTAILVWMASGGRPGESLGLWQSEEPARAVSPENASGAPKATKPSKSDVGTPTSELGGAAVPGLPDLSTSAGAEALAERSVRRALDPVNIARGMLREGRHKAARWHALGVLARGERAEHAPNHPSARQLGRARRAFRDAIRRDESLRQSVVTIGEDVEAQKLHALGGGWSVTFRFTRHGQSIWAFKPAQKDWEQGWKAEIAAWRFCEVVACHFRIPRNRPARISKAHFERLYGRVDGREQKSYRERFDSLIWREEKGPSGEQREYLYGTLKDWVPSFAKWPIEYKSTWRPWMSASADAGMLDQPIDQSLKPLRDKISDAWWKRIDRQIGDASTRSIARQISSLMVFDYVTTNWDRFSNFEEYYGVNNQFADGHFVSIDNGAAFAYNDFGEVMARFSEVQRYSRRTIASLRALSKESMNPVLFPDPTPRGKKRLRRFWAQRARLLERIADLKEEYGAESVMAFR